LFTRAHKITSLLCSRRITKQIIHLQTVEGGGGVARHGNSHKKYLMGKVYYHLFMCIVVFAHN
jgi:hypothetical protein